MATTLRPPSIQSLIPTPTVAPTAAPVVASAPTTSTSSGSANLAAIRAANQAKSAKNKEYITATMDVPEKTPYMMQSSAARMNADGVMEVIGGSAKYVDKYGKVTTGSNALPLISSYQQAKYDKETMNSNKSDNTPASGRSNINLSGTKFETPKVNVGTLDSDSSWLLSPKPNKDIGINKDGGTSDKKYKEGTYLYFVKELGNTPTEARQAVKDMKNNILGKEVVAPKSETELYNPENIYEKGEKMKKDITEDTKKVDEDIAESKRQSELDKLNENLGILNEQSARISAERDNAIKELDDLIAGYETNRLSQVRGGIMQALAQRGVNISQLSPETLIQLSGEVGSKAFTDIYNAKESSKAKVQALRQSAVNSLNEIAAKQGMSRNEYTNALSEINTAAKTDSNNLDTQLAEFIFGAGEKKVNTDIANKSAATNALYTILTNANVPLDQQAMFSSLASKPGATAESVLRDLQSNLSPEQKKVISDARSAAAAVSNNATKLAIAEMNNDTKLTIAKQNAANSAARIAKMGSGPKKVSLSNMQSYVNNKLKLLETTADPTARAQIQSDINTIQPRIDEGVLQS